MKTINSGFNFRRARNGEHYQAHADILNAISEAFVSGQGIKALRDAYAKLYELEDECYLRNQAYEDTLEIAEADQLRDELFLFVSQTIETNKLSPVAANREAAGRLGFVLDPYKDGLPPEVEKQLNDRYEELFRIFYKHRDQIDRVTFWGLTDDRSWKNNYPVPRRTNYPQLFNRDYSAKDGLYAVLRIPDEK